MRRDAASGHLLGRHVDARAATRVRPVRIRHPHPAHVWAKLLDRHRASGGAFDGGAVVWRELPAPSKALVQVLLMQADFLGYSRPD